MPSLLYDMQLRLVSLRNMEEKNKRFLNKTYTITKKYNGQRFEGTDHILKNQREQRNEYKK